MALSARKQRLINPVIRGVVKKGEIGAEDCCSYKSIFVKSAVFLLLVVFGVAIGFVMHAITDQITILETENVTISCSTVELALAIILLIVGVISTIIATFSTRLALVFGAIGSISYGYLLGFLAVFMPTYQGPMVLALVLTVAVVAVLVLLYRFKIIKVNKKFTAVLWILIGTMILASIILFICSFIPATQNAVQWIVNNSVLSIIFGVVGVIIASMFLLSDFSCIESAVESRMDKKYENRLAFGLAFSVVWLYLKILDLVLTIMGNSNNND